MRKLLKFNNNYTTHALHVGNLYECIYVVYVRIFICVSVSVCVSLSVRVCICLSIRMCIDMYRCTYMYSLLKTKFNYEDPLSSPLPGFFY